MELKTIFKNTEIDYKSKREIIKSLRDKINEALEKGYRLKDVFNFIKTIEKFPDMSYDYFRNEFYKLKSSNNILKKVAIVNFKGGVGKSTIANLLDLPNKVVVNLDTQNAKNSNYSETINYLELKEEYGVDINETINLLKEEGKEWIIFDTPGSITDEFLEIIDNIDYFIIPFTKGNRSKETTIDTIKSLLEVLDNKKAKFALILNMYQDEEDIINELLPIEEEVKEMLKDNYACSAALKFSKAVATMEKTKKSIEELDLTNKIAYKAFKKRVEEMNKKLKECLFKE